jgi:hypothetical protein
MTAKIKLQFYPTKVELARKGVLLPHKTEKPFDVECELSDIELIIKKQIMGFNSYTINFYLCGQRIGCTYEGTPYYSLNGKVFHRLKDSNASLETVVNKIYSSYRFYNGIGDTAKSMVDAARDKPSLKIV